MFDTPLFLCRNSGLSLDQQVAKRALDLICGVLAFIVASPFMLITAAAIKLYDRGPVLFKQKRLTIGGKEFNVYKFRSMVVDAEKDGVARLATQHDDRITPVGRIIRKIRFDELPQILNILKGDMSIVGPRPERPEIAEEYKKDMKFVLPVRIQNSTSYAINGKTNTIMFFFNVTYVDPGPEYVADGEGVPDDHTLEGGYKLLWHDEFNGTGAPNAEMWRFEEGFQRNEEDQWYKKENAEMKENALVFTAKQERVKNPNYNPNATGGNSWKQTREYAEYTSACVVATSNYAFKYGRLIVRAKIPIEQGGWPAIWSTGNWYEWPLGGEIDILEFYKEKIHANLCWGGSKRWDGSWNSANYPITDFTSKDAKWAEKYHIWRMDWDEKYIRIYLDDVLLNETDLSTTNNKGDHGAGDGGNINPYSNDMVGFGQLMMLNLAIGGVNGRPVEATFPLEYRVDYVRVYQK